MATIPERFEAVRERASLRDYCDANLTRAAGGKYVCPACGSGTGPHRTPAFSLEPDGLKWHCFACGQGGDLCDLVGIVAGTDDRMQQLEIAERFAGIATPAGESVSYRRGLNQANQAAPATASMQQARRVETKPVDYAAGRAKECAYIAKCLSSMSDDCAGMAYLTSRGLTPDEVRNLGIGYDPQRRRVVLPFYGGISDWYHIDRAIDEGVQPKYLKPRAEEVGEQPAFNPAAFAADSLIVTEGAFDSMAVWLAGGNSTALLTTGHRDFVRALKERGYTGVVCIMLDADEAGRKASEALAQDLDTAGIMHLEVQQLEGCKDAADALTMPGGRERLAALVSETKARAGVVAHEAAESRYAAVLNAARVLDPVNVARTLYDGTAAVEPVSTGLSGLDATLDGGLMPGLTVLGAISSLGKTTLLVQVADHIAAQGRPVVFVTIEEPASALVAKSLTRIMAAHGCKDLAGVKRPAARASWDEATRAAFAAALEEYGATVAPCLRYMEPNQRPKVSTIRGVVQAVADRYGCPPVVIVDYLQLVSSENPHDTDKQQVDANVTALCQIGAEFRSPVVAVSSLNRSSYSDEIGLTAFKESGAIEYSANVLIGMQPEHFGARIEAGLESAAKKNKMTDYMRRKIADDIIDEAKHDARRHLELVIIKNRGGVLPDEPVQVVLDAAAATYSDAEKVTRPAATPGDIFAGWTGEVQVH